MATSIITALKLFPCGTKLYHPDIGYLTLSEVTDRQIICYPAGISDEDAVDSSVYVFDEYGCLHVGEEDSGLYLVDEYNYKSQPWTKICNKIKKKFVYIRGKERNALGVIAKLKEFGAININFIDRRIDNTSVFANSNVIFFINHRIQGDDKCNVGQIYLDDLKQDDLFFLDMIYESFIEIKPDKLKKDLKPGTIVYVTDDLVTGVKAAKYEGNGEARLICSPLPKGIFNYIFDPNEISYISPEQCFNYAIYRKNE